MVERSEQELVRLAKLEKLREKRYPFPNDVRVTSNTLAILDQEVREPAVSERHTIAGRLVQIRLMGKAAFVHLLDGAGKLQLYIRSDQVSLESFEELKSSDIGDLIEARGYLFVTKTGEKSLHVEAWRLLTKSLIPLPEKWHGLTDVESRYRYRYVDLISNPEVRDLFRIRARIIQTIREFLNDRGYLEVETPILNTVASGASAKPFATHHNALGCDMLLRIALELPLKKLIVGGFERVYEIGRNFRNEGISRKHNPEFTMLEFYQAYATYEDLMNLTEELLVMLVQRVVGTTSIQYGDQTIDFSRPWRRISMRDSVYEIGGVGRDYDLDTLQGVVAAAAAHRVHLEEPSDWGRSLESLWGELVEPKLINPTFITQHPFSISPLARQNQSDLKVTDRFELIVAGMELANAFSELNDPIDQRERFESQAQRRELGDEEAPEVDEDFLRALEYGMPPTAGQGIGIDRLVMLLTNSASIRDVVLFPQLKPESSAISADRDESGRSLVENGTSA
jgi:lysyl-tRNA synthetase class 2